MSIRHLRIERFRGIRELDWTVGHELVCLVGPGDSGKTTILDAIEWALWPRWSLQVTDADFHELDPSQDIIVEVTLSPVPNELAADGVYAQHLRGWKEGALLEEPEDGAETAITVRLEVGKDLEPEWSVMVDRDTIEPLPIGWRRRALLGVLRLGGRYERDLTWARGSAFSRAVDVDGTGAILTQAHREARGSVEVDLNGLAESLESIGQSAAGFGVGADAVEELEVVLNPMITGLGAGALVLAGSGVPLARAGLGTSRLAALAIQALAAGEEGILLVDEVEHGLEPHRIIGLISELRRRLNGGNGGDETGGRVFMTTHSPVAVCEIGADGVHVVHREDGAVAVQAASADLVDLVRAFPSALLARRVIVCEGRTEVGLFRGLERVLWEGEEGKDPLPHHGVVIVDGGGNRAPLAARRLAELGYDVLLFADSDVALGIGAAELQDAGVEVVQWDGEVATEERMAADLPLEGLMEIVRHVVDARGCDSVRDSLNSRLDGEQRLDGDEPTEWVGQIGEDEFRRVFGVTAKEGEATGEVPKPKGWFKTIDGGEVLGELVAEYWDRLGGTDLEAALSRIRQWVYQDGG